MLPSHIKNRSLVDDLNILSLNHTEKLIIKFVSRWKGEIPPSASDVSSSLNLPPSTVVSALKRMKKSSATKEKRRRPQNISEIFKWEPRRSIIITEFGKTIANHIERHHHFLEKHLTESLKMTQEEAHKESENLGTIVSCTLVEKIQIKYHPSLWEKGCNCPDDKEFCNFLFKES